MNMFEGFFGNLFDFDGNGELDSLELAADFAFLAQLMEEDSQSGDYGDSDASDF